MYALTCPILIVLIVAYCVLEAIEAVADENEYSQIYSNQSVCLILIPMFSLANIMKKNIKEYSEDEPYEYLKERKLMMNVYYILLIMVDTLIFLYPEAQVLQKLSEEHLPHISGHLVHLLVSLSL